LKSSKEADYYCYDRNKTQLKEKREIGEDTSRGPTKTPSDKRSSGQSDKISRKESARKVNSLGINFKKERVKHISSKEKKKRLGKSLGIGRVIVLDDRETLLTQGK